MAFQERELNKEEIAQLKSDNRYGFKLLEIKKRDATAREICHQELQNDFRAGTRRSDAQESVEIAFALGATWGNQLVKEFGWTWICIEANGVENYVVASGNRSVFVAPAPFVKLCLDKPDTRCNILFAFDLIDGGSLDSLAENGYANLMVSLQQAAKEPSR
ncbi:MAG TPA: hypothetical protein PKD05_02410 [Candidatus Melainabacteria bacterium]|nr:hypothetical protein [Candidatus Melainabacteria bacterium]